MVEKLALDQFVFTACPSGSLPKYIKTKVITTFF